MSWWLNPYYIPSLIVFAFLIAFLSKAFSVLGTKTLVAGNKWKENIFCGSKSICTIDNVLTNGKVMYIKLMEKRVGESYALENDFQFPGKSSTYDFI